MWNYIETFGEELYRICLRGAGYDHDLANELMSDVVYARLERIIELWDPARGPVQNFVNKNIKLYVYKHMQRERKLSKPFTSIDDDDELEYSEDQTARVEVLTILETLTPYEQDLIWSCFALNISRRELAKRLGVSHPVITQQLNAILAKIHVDFPSTCTGSSSEVQED